MTRASQGISVTSRYPPAVMTTPAAPNRITKPDEVADLDQLADDYPHYHYRLGNQLTVDYPDEFAPGYHVILGDGRVVTVNWDQVISGHILPGHRYLTYQSTILPIAFENQGSVS